MIKKKYSHRTIHDAQIQKLYLAAKAVAVPKVISEQMCPAVSAQLYAQSKAVFSQGCAWTPTAHWVCALSEMLCAQ